MHPMLPTLQPPPDASALGAIVLAVLGVASEARTAAAADCRIALGGAPAAPAPFGVDAAASSSSPETPPGREARAVFALLGGMRGGVGKLLSPALEGSAAIELDRWELGVKLVVEVQYFDLGGGEPPAPPPASESPSGGTSLSVRTRRSCAPWRVPGVAARWGRTRLCASISSVTRAACGYTKPSSSSPSAEQD